MSPSRHSTSVDRIADIGDDDPVPLAEACRLFFRGAIKPSTLRSEARRGNLEIERIGHKDFVTAKAIREMRRKCLVQRSDHDYGSVQRKEIHRDEFSGRPPGSSSTEADTSPRDALNLKLRRLTGS
mgnify:CR=1 FL=1